MSSSQQVARSKDFLSVSRQKHRYVSAFLVCCPSCNIRSEMKSISVLCLLAVFLAFTLDESYGQVGNAGAKVVLTKQGLDYAAWHAVEVMDRKVRETHIEDVSGQTKVKIGKVDYEFKNTRITSFTKPTPSVIVNPGQGLTLSLNGAGVAATGEWRYKYRKAFIKIRDHGTFRASADGVSISVSVSLGRNDNGSPRIAATGCHCSISDVHIKLSGGASWLYNIFIRFFKNKIKSSFENTICKEAQNAINQNGAATLATLNMQARINDVLEINYALAADPIFGDNFMESNHVGRFLNDDVVENAPAMYGSLDHMVSASITDVSLNSGIRVLFKHSKLQWGQDLMGEELVGTVFGMLEEAGIALSGVGLGVSVGATSPPVVTTQPGSILINGEVEGKIDVLQADGSRSTGFSVKISLQLQIHGGIRGDKVIGSVSHFTPTLTYCSVPNFKPDLINAAISQLIGLLLPSINEALAQGLPLPSLQGIQFVDSVLHLNDRHITVATNVHYAG